MEQCPICKVALRIARSYLQVRGDSSPDTPTQAATVQELVCPNPQCERYGQVAKTLEHPTPVCSVSQEG